MNTTNFLAFSDVHPIVAVTFAVVALGLAIVAYKLLALVLDSFLAVIGRPRTVRTLRETLKGMKPKKLAVQAPAASREPSPAAAPALEDEDEKLEKLRCAFKDLGCPKTEYEPILAKMDISKNDVPTILRSTLLVLRSQMS